MGSKSGVKSKRIYQAQQVSAIPHSTDSEFTSILSSRVNVDQLGTEAFGRRSQDWDVDALGCR